MNSRQEANVILGVLALGLVVMFCAGAYLGSKVGYRHGFNAAEIEGVEKNLKLTRQLMNSCSDDNTDAYNRGVESAKYECNEMVNLGERVCVMSLKASYMRGQRNGLKRAQKVCGVKIKFQDEQ